MRLAVSGAMGRMGSECVRIFREEGAELAFCVDPRAINDCFAEFSEVPKTLLADVIVDFSAPSALEGLLAFCLERGTAAVIATTGFTSGQTDRIAEAATEIPIFLSRNMSVGVHLLGRLCRDVCAVSGIEYDIEIVETHHAAKRDAPSGTALHLADLLRTESSVFVYDRRNREKRKPGEIGIHALRGGSVIGRHDVHFFMKGETLTLTHNAENRELFARGAYTAARFLCGKPPGLYTMDDLFA